MKRKKSSEDFLRKYVVPLTLLSAVFCVGMFVSVFVSVRRYSDQNKDSAAPAVASSSTHIGIAPPSSEIVQELKASKGFQVLVMYTGEGFSPATSTIKKGQTVRFTNNSTTNVWVAEVTDLNTPSHPNTTNCDVPFNSCEALRPTEFKEFTFPAAGTFYYIDNLSTTTRGAVVVVQ